jgi:sigma-B regulation protein RsbU (phosphoserine phosphatase)
MPGADSGLDLAARVVSSRELCGDIYDFLRYGPQELAIAMGDVSGKGSAAALYGAAAIGIMRSLGPNKLVPAQMLHDMNQLIVERRIEGRFMTMCFATYHRGKRKLRFANAGQEEPILFHKGECKKINLAGFPLGMFEDVVYEEINMILDPGDIIAFYSDGITDTQNFEKEFYGTAPIIEIICSHAAEPSAAIADRVLEQVDLFSGSQHAFDDRTLLVLKVL